MSGPEANTVNTGFCAIGGDGEEGICRTHLAERWGMPYWKVRNLILNGRLDGNTMERRLDCKLHVKTRSTIVPFGQIMQYEDEVLGYDDDFGSYK